MEITEQHIENVISIVVIECYRHIFNSSDIETVFQHYTDANSKLNIIHLLCSSNEVALWIHAAKKNIHAAYINANTSIFVNKSNTIELFPDGTFSLRTTQLSYIQSEDAEDRGAEILNYLLIL